MFLIRPAVGIVGCAVLDSAASLNRQSFIYLADSRYCRMCGIGFSRIFESLIEDLIKDRFNGGD